MAPEGWMTAVDAPEGPATLCKPRHQQILAKRMCVRAQMRVNACAALCALYVRVHVCLHACVCAAIARFRRGTPNSENLKVF